MTTKTILVTGGAGYIGSHCVLALLEQNYKVIVIDNLVNSYKKDKNSTPESLIRVQKLTNKKITFYQADLQETNSINKIFKNHPEISTVFHFAALKSREESRKNPVRYYDSNVLGSTSLITVMRENGVRKLIFSSSAAIYGPPEYLPLGLGGENFFKKV